MWNYHFDWQLKLNLSLLWAAQTHNAQCTRNPSTQRDAPWTLVGRLFVLSAFITNNVQCNGNNLLPGSSAACTKTLKLSNTTENGCDIWCSCTYHFGRKFSIRFLIVLRQMAWCRISMTAKSMDAYRHRFFDWKWFVYSISLLIYMDWYN